MSYPNSSPHDDFAPEEREWSALFGELSDAAAPVGMAEATLSRWRAEASAGSWLTAGWVRSLVVVAVGLGGGGVYLAWLLRGFGFEGLRALAWSHVLTQGIAGVLGLLARVSATWEAMADVGLAMARLAMRPQWLVVAAAAFLLSAYCVFILQRLLAFQRRIGHV